MSIIEVQKPFTAKIAVRPYQINLSEEHIHDIKGLLHAKNSQKMSKNC